MYHAHNEGSMVHNALWTVFPEDTNTLSQDYQYMWNNGILFTPVITERSNSVTGYFPSSLWYSLFDDVMIDTSNGGEYISLDTPFYATNVHVRGGTVLPLQDFAMTTEGVRSSPFTLLLALDHAGKAAGDLFLDDGKQISLDSITLISYSVTDSTLISTVKEDSYRTDLKVRAVTILYPRAEHGETCSESVVSVSSGSFQFTASGTRSIFNNFNRIDVSLQSIESGAVNVSANFKLSWGGC